MSTFKLIKVFFKMKEQKKKIQLKQKERLTKYGFEKKKLNYYIRIVEDNVIQTIGFSHATHGENHTVYITPIVGVTYRNVNKLMIQLRNLSPDVPEYYTPMISLPIGYQMPVNDYKEWKFTIDQDVEKEANDMADAIIQYGFPYMEELTNEDELVYGLEISRYSYICEQVYYILPILHYLRGNNKRALECMDEFIERLSYFPPQDEYDRIKALAGDNGEFCIVNNGLKAYLAFVENFKLLIQQ